ncbi:TetR/AcrR family transcriptional regulator C-terminal domain-containing protein [Kribbella sp. NPDC050281]|uniref:TetR/AcrR family transcriptional regulator n=1 Tax=Kribbella sp. NPDC050281 TaxID=3155515 RepID=UPI0033CAE0BE
MADRTPPTRNVLTRDYIATVALDLIDRIGLGKFSMRKLGAELGADPMAAYRHYADQEDLYDGIAELLFDALETDALPWDGDWRDLCSAYCERLRDTLLQHPHAVTVFASRPVRSPASIATGNRMIAKLQDADFTPAEALQIARCLREFTIGHALTMAVVALGAGDRSRKPAPADPTYNLLAEAADAEAQSDAEAEADAEAKAGAARAGAGGHFRLGLQAMLDGFSAGRGRSRGRR